MSAVDDILGNAKALVQAGSNLLNGHSQNDSPALLRFPYESWYTAASGLIRQILPQRLIDFERAYKLEKRKEINVETYTISDYLTGISITDGLKNPVFDNYAIFQGKFFAQIAILNSASDSLKSVLHDVRTILRAELFDDDLEAAKELLKKGHLRSAGVVSGVVLEAHLKSVAARRGITFTKKNLTISDLNDALRNGSAYDVPTWRHIQRLGDIRNLCGHSRERDPNGTEVDELILGVDKVIKEVF
ncbi:MAG TPA: hypothetical protein VMH80_06100 [Bryobacteraceae bacterium]|nr:hypothetical protein [Bryobacteraceae bacterium]